MQKLTVSRRLSYRLLSMVLLFLLMLCESAHAISPSDISAKSAVVIEQKTRRVLFEKNAYEKLPMASITKVMTAILALESGDPEQVVTIQKGAAGVEGSSIYLTEGEKIRMIDLVYGLMLESGNDAAVAIAQQVSGSVDEFVKLMNQKAKELGANDTQFQNPNGLPADGHYTTAYDWACITAYALENENFAKVVSTKKYTSNHENNSKVKVFVNHNRLLNEYEGCTGVKTGYTKTAGRTLVSSAVRNGIQVICVTLCDPNDWQDHRNLFDSMFEKYSVSKLVESGKILKTAEVRNGEFPEVGLVSKEEFSYPVFEDELGQVSYVYNVPSQFKAPVEEGQEMGTVDVYYKKNKIATLPLYANSTIAKVEEPKPTIGEIFNKITKTWLMIFKFSDIIEDDVFAPRGY